MTPRQVVTPLQLAARLDRLRQTLRALMLGDVLVWMIGALAVALAAGAVLRVTTGSPTPASSWGAALLVAAAVGSVRWRVLRPHGLARLDTALWIESQAPALQYAMVTLAEQEPASDGDPVQSRLAAFTAATAWEPQVAAALSSRRRSLLLRAVPLLPAVLVAAWPWQARRAVASVAGITTPVTDSASAVPGRVKAQVVLVPPSYAGRSERTLAFGQTVVALAGSVLRVDGVGARGNATLLVQESSDSGAGSPVAVHVTPRADGWRGDVRIGTVPLALRLRDGVGERWLLVTPVADSSPVATLRLPSADTLVFDTTAVLRVSGTVHDDIGLRDARIEYIISSGGGEQFTFRSGALSERRGALGRDATLATTLNLGTLGLKPGDLMHVRITAHDGNTRSGPSLGTSETRTIRIPRADERDSVAIEQLPPSPVDKSVLSQRQLLVMTERLVARMARLERSVMLAESRRLGNDQARLRKQVADIVFARLGDNPSGEHAHFAGDGHEHTPADLAAQPPSSAEAALLQAADRATGGVSGMLDAHGDETPVVAVNRPLLEAYNAMWDATRALQGGVPRAALEPMRRALAAIQRARSAERIYLRGTPAAPVVDLEKIRLLGTDSANFEARRALDALPAPERRLAVRVLRSLGLVAQRHQGALDSLRLVRLDALGSATPLAEAVGAAIEALDAGRPATDALRRVRRLALAPWLRSEGSALWLGGTP